MNLLVSQGVEELINKLREEGVNAGKEKADKLTDDAKTQASEIIESAMEEAERIVTEARIHAEAELNSGKNALVLAARDMLLEFQQNLTRKFSEETERLLTESLDNKDLINKIILLLCNNTLEEVGDLSSKDKEVLLSESSGEMQKLIKQIGTKTLNNGITLGTFSEDATGIYVKIDNGKIKIDFTNKALTQALLEHLQPRFKDILEGLLSK